MDVESGRKLSECKLNPSCRGLSSTSMIELIDIDYFIVTPRDSGLKSPSFWLISLVLDRLAKYLQLTLEIITCGHLQHSLAASSWKIHVHFWFVAKSTWQTLNVHIQKTYLNKSQQVALCLATLGMRSEANCSKAFCAALCWAAALVDATAPTKIILATSTSYLAMRLGSNVVPQPTQHTQTMLKHTHTYSST